MFLQLFLFVSVFMPTKWTTLSCNILNLDMDESKTTTICSSIESTHGTTKTGYSPHVGFRIHYCKQYSLTNDESTKKRMAANLCCKALCATFTSNFRIFPFHKLSTISRKLLQFPSRRTSSMLSFS